MAGANIADIGSAVGAISESLITSIGAVSDAKKRREYEQTLANLNSDQQKALNDKLVSAKSETDRQNILAATLSASSLARIQAITNPDADANKTKRTIFIVAGVIAAAAILGYVALRVVKKGK